MANQARVTSTDALELFRVALIVFLTKARRSMDDVGEEVRRTRQWLQHDQRLHWESEIRRRAKILAQKQQELFSAQLTQNSEATSMARQASVNKAMRELTEAEEKLRRVKKWNQAYDSCADPVVKRLESLRQFLDSDMPKAITYLANVEKTLDAYANAPAPETGTATTTAAAPPDEPASRP